jgi:hypothetical protein
MEAIMTSRALIWSFALVTALVFVFLMPFTLRGKAKSTTPTVRSWHGTWVGNATIVGNCKNGVLQFVESGVGYAEQAGMSKWSDKYCMDPTTWTASGRSAVITAENGDKVCMKIELLFIWNSKTAGNWVEHETIIGGTGKFAAATGGSHSRGTFALTDPKHAQWDGIDVGLISS